ncbi:ketosteroid isomerase-like protein [Streptococcus rupicaprae]|uniref:Ketosteroid isomerase-like protein n=1 Tax=Streptococcus rupicaprae TaxID=759619 RepID=A0ABV2FFX9_9STRE
MVTRVKQLSKQIWSAKLANDTKKIADFIADNAKFVHMGITFDKKGELDAFDSQKFIYKHVAITDEWIEDYGQTVIIFKKLVLTAQVGDSEVENPFIVSEIFTKTNQDWYLVGETYTRIANDFDSYQVL